MSPGLSRNSLKLQTVNQNCPHIPCTPYIQPCKHKAARAGLHTQNTHLSIETYDCGNKMHKFLFISRTCEGPSELRGHIDFPSFHAVTLGLPIFSFIFKDNVRFFLPLFSVFSFFHHPPHPHIPSNAHTYTHAPTSAAVAPTPFPQPSPSLTLKIVIQP